MCGFANLSELYPVIITRFAYFAITRAASKPMPFIDVPVIKTIIEIQKNEEETQEEAMPFFPSIVLAKTSETSSAVVSNINVGNAIFVWVKDSPGALDSSLGGHHASSR